MASFTVIYDANVLYPYTVRDILMELAVTGLHQARWTEDIQQEWLEALRKHRPDIPKDKLENLCALMNQNAPDCLVEGYEPLIDSVQLPDPKDRHVLAAAIKANADVIVTYNLKDFPEKALAPHGVEAQHPDVFLTHALDLSKGIMCETVKRCRQRNQNPPYSVEEYLSILEERELTQFVSELREFTELL